MATRRRDAFPGKERVTPSPQTGASKLRGAVNQVSKPKVSTAPAKVTRPAVSRTPTTTTTAVSKPQTRKPATPTTTATTTATATATKPAPTRTRTLSNKTANPTPKARVPTTASASAAATSPRSSSLPVKTVASPQRAPVKTWKPVANEDGKRRLSNVSAASGGRRSSIGCKKESRNTASAKKEQKQINTSNLDKNEDLSIYSVPEPEMQLQDIEYSYLAEAEEKTVQSLSDFEKIEKGIDVVRDDQEMLSSTKLEDMVNYADPSVVTGESTIISEHQAPPVVIKQESEKKQELQHDLKETNNKVEKTADNLHEEAKEKEVKVIEVAEEQRAPIVSKADEPKVIEPPAVEKKRENPVHQKLQEKMHGKYDSPVSNDVIEETANKLRELRRNKVRALAGAFETVISLQEK